MTLGVPAMSVATRFEAFLSNLKLTDDQISNGKARRESVVKALNANYYDTSDSTAHSSFVGSWGKATRIRPPRDVDVLYELPASVYHRFEKRSGNKQSQLLQEVKDVLLKTFSSTDIKGDGPVVDVPFTAYDVELIPSFKLDNGQFWICITKDGGSYKVADYTAETTAVSDSNSKTGNNTRDLVRMMKCWQAYCSVSLRSFWIELVAIDFLATWPNAGKTAMWYDWMVRDFLAHLISKKNTYVYAPGTREAMNLGDAWVSRADTAFARAKKACELEGTDAEAAGDEWQKIFGTDIPRKP
jgi:hypothetical protein